MNDELWLKAAHALAGRPININFREPIIKDFDGQAYYLNGQATIDIRAGLDDQVTLKILCHEAAHFRLGTAFAEPPGQQPGSQRLTDLGKYLRKAHPVTVERETGADRLASVWMDYAERHAAEYPGDSILERELKALASYLSPELRSRLNNAALKGAHEVLDVFLWKLQQEKLANKGVKRDGE